MHQAYRNVYGMTLNKSQGQHKNGMVIIEVAYFGDRVRLWCMDRYDQSRENRLGIYNEHAVYISATGDIPAVGDDVWWGSDTVYWTPADRRFQGRPLSRVARSPRRP